MDKLIELSKNVKVSVHLEFNPHKDYYEPAQTYFSKQNYFLAEELEGVDLDGDLWVLQFYPDTPIGFYRLVSNDLDDLLTRALKIQGVTMSTPDL